MLSRLIVAAALCAAGPAMAQDFRPKPETLNQITISLTGERILREGPPRSQTTTFTSSGRYNSTSTTIDTTPLMPRQYLRINNRSIYDVKDIVVECSYLGESGTALGAQSQMFPYRFNTGRSRTVALQNAPTGLGR